MSTGGEVTTLLERAREGDDDAFGELIGRIYGELRLIARGQRRRLGAADTMNTTALVHEAYAKLAGSAAASKNGRRFADRGHFFRIAARVMRDVVVDYARAQSAQKRGGAGRPATLHEHFQPIAADVSLNPEEVISVHEALGKLEELDEQAARVAELRYFVGLTAEQTGEALGLSTATVKRRWVVARAWLFQRLSDEDG